MLSARRPRAGHLLLLPTPGRRLEVPRDPHVPLSSSLTLPLVSLILSRDGRARPSPPIAVVAARDIPSPFDEPISSASTPSSSPPSHASPEALHRCLRLRLQPGAPEPSPVEFAAARTSPSR